MQKWTPDELTIIKAILHQFGGSPSRAYEKHPDWKKKLLAGHTAESLYAKIHGLKKKSAPKIKVPTTTAVHAKRLVVLRDGEVQTITCPNCSHAFNVVETV